MGIRRIVFWVPPDLSYGSPPNDLWETAGYRVRKIVFGSPQIDVQSPSNVPRQPFSGTFHGYSAMFPRLTYNDSMCNVPLLLGTAAHATHWSLRPRGSTTMVQQNKGTQAQQVRVQLRS